MKNSARNSDWHKFIRLYGLAITERRKGMYFVPDGTELCGFYECADCYSRFLDIRIAPRLVCPYCGKEVDMEIGPDDETPVATESAKLLQTVEGEDVEKFDTLLSLAITGGDYKWI